jgi:dTMP kinase
MSGRIKGRGERSLSQGLFMTFEGMEGCGKTTQVKRLARRLQGLGVPAIVTLEPGGTRIGKKIRRVLLDAGNKALTPLAELMLYAADRAQHVEEIIQPALRAGKWVICDRFSDATVVYQGMARGQDMKLVKLLNETVTRRIRPDITFLLDCPVDLGLQRALRRNLKGPHKGQDRFEKEKISFHRKVRNAYLELARKERKRFVVIDGTLHRDEVEGEIFKKMQPFLEHADRESIGKDQS